MDIVLTLIRSNPILHVGGISALIVLGAIVVHYGIKSILLTL